MTLRSAEEWISDMLGQPTSIGRRMAFVRAIQRDALAAAMHVALDSSYAARAYIAADISLLIPKDTTSAGEKP